MQNFHDCVLIVYAVGGYNSFMLKETFEWKKCFCHCRLWQTDTVDWKAELSSFQTAPCSGNEMKYKHNPAQPWGGDCDTYIWLSLTDLELVPVWSFSFLLPCGEHTIESLNMNKHSEQIQKTMYKKNQSGHAFFLLTYHVFHELAFPVVQWWVFKVMTLVIGPR